MDELRKKIMNYVLHSDEKTIVIPYDGPRLTSTIDWPRYRNNFRLAINGVLHEILKFVPPCDFKNWIMRRMGYKIGKDVAICNYTYLDPLFPELITIEDGVLVGAYAVIDCHEMVHKDIKLGRVHIKKGAIVGGFAYVRNGVTIGENACVAMGAWAFKDVPDNTIVIGQPAKPVKVLQPGEIVHLKMPEEKKEEVKAETNVEEKKEEMKHEVKSEEKKVTKKGKK